MKAGVAEREEVHQTSKSQNLPTAAGRRPRRKPCCFWRLLQRHSGAKRRDRACTARGERGDPKRAAAPRCTTTFVDSSEAGRAMGVHLTSSVNIKRRRGSSDDGWLLYSLTMTDRRHISTFCSSLLFIYISTTFFWGGFICSQGRLPPFCRRGDSGGGPHDTSAMPNDARIQFKCCRTATAAVEAISSRTTYYIV